MNLRIAILVSFGMLAGVALAGTPRLLTVSPQDDFLREIDPNTGATLSTTLLSIPGSSSIITQGLGLAVDPTTGALYAMVSLLGQAEKELLRVDPTTGACVDVGNTLEKFAGIAFDSSGQLFGVSGDGGIVSEALYKIDKATAQSTLLTVLGNGSVGESLMFNPFDGQLYHASGVGTLNDPLLGQILEKVDPTTLAITPVTLSGPLVGMQAMTRHDAVTIFGVDFSPTLVKMTTSGVATPIGSLDHIAKGIAWFDGPSQFTPYGAGCVGSGGFTPVLAGIGTPNPGSNITLSISQALGGAQGFLFLGLGTGTAAVVPACSLQVMPIVPQLIVALPMLGVGPGGGGIALPATIPTNVLPFDVYLQVLVSDPGAAGSVASSNPLRMHLQ